MLFALRTYIVHSVCRWASGHIYIAGHYTSTASSVGALSCGWRASCAVLCSCRIAIGYLGTRPQRPDNRSFLIPYPKYVFVYRYNVHDPSRRHFMLQHAALPLGTLTPQRRYDAQHNTSSSSYSNSTIAFEALMQSSCKMYVMWHV